MDICACVSAEKHAKGPTVTISMDSFQCAKESLRIADVVVLTGKMTRVFRTSMEIGVSVERENPLTGVSEELARVFFSFLAQDGTTGKGLVLRGLTTVTEQERTDYQLGDERRKVRFNSGNILASTHDQSLLPTTSVCHWAGVNHIRLFLVSS